MEAEGRVAGPLLPLPFPSAGGGAGTAAEADSPAGAPGAARGPLLAAAAEVLALDDEEDDLEVFSKPLPEKFIMKGMVERFSDEFIETRRKALHKFLNRIADHPTLTFNEDFKIFLTAQAWELSSHKKQGPGLLSRMGQTVRAVASSVRGGVKNRPEMFTEMNNYMETFSQKIIVLDKIAHRIYKEEREYFNEMKEYGPIHTLWSASEEDIADSLKGVASCIEKCCRATEKRMAGLSEHLLPILHEYVLYSEILMGVLKRRDQIQSEFESKVDVLANKKMEKDLFLEEIGKLEDKVECANNALKVDWDRWKQNMKCDMRSMFTNMAENNLRYYEEIHQFFGAAPLLAVVLPPWKEQRGNSSSEPERNSHKL
ncbi:sorting nexin-7 isoform X7 [Heliangelus exortis]|uniref:sorting nexin-7 isoform X7 n=1 Tax=Heliangelus exortis TaxID=472823 RepID=UPI003A8DFA2D